MVAEKPDENRRERERAEDPCVTARRVTCGNDPRKFLRREAYPFTLFLSFLFQERRKGEYGNTLIVICEQNNLSDLASGPSQMISIVSRMYYNSEYSTCDCPIELILLKGPSKKYLLIKKYLNYLCGTQK